MEYKFTCRNLVFEEEFRVLLSEIHARAVFGKLQKKTDTIGKLMTANLSEEGGDLATAYTFGKQTFATYWRGQRVGTDKLALVGGYLFLALTTPTSVDVPPQEVLAEVRTILAEHNIQTVKSETSELAAKTVTEAFTFLTKNVF